MKKIFTFFTLMAFIAIYHSQITPNWFLNFGAITNTSANIKDTVIDSNDNVYAFGSFAGWSNFYDNTNNNVIFASGANTNSFVAKYSPTGSLIWVKTFTVDIGAIAVDNNENIILTGSFKDTVTFSDNITFTATLPNQPQVYIIKLNKTDGSFMWKNTISNGVNDYKPSYPTCLTVLNDNSIVVGAQYIGNVMSAYRLNLIKFDLNGNLVSFKPFINDNSRNGYDFQGLKSDNNDNIYVVGSFYYDINMSLQNGGQYLLTDPSANNSLTAFIAKYDSQFNILWAKSIGAAGADQALALEVDKTTGKSFVSIAISGNCDLNNGSTPAAMTNIYQTNNTGVLAIYNSTGNLEYSNVFTGAGFNIGRAYIRYIQLKENKLVLSGQVYNNPDVDISGASLFVPNAEVNTIMSNFLSVYTINNNTFTLDKNIFFARFINTQNDNQNLKGLLNNDNSKLFITGNSQSLRPYQGTEIFTSASPFGGTMNNSYILNINNSQILSTDDVQKNKNLIQIAENPVKDNLKIITNDVIIKITLYSNEGKLIRSFSAKETNLSDLPIGIYYLKIQTQSTIQYKKVIKR